LHDPPELVIDQIEVRAVGGYRPGEIKSGVLRSNSSIRWCTVALKHERVTSDTFDSRKYYSK